MKPILLIFPDIELLFEFKDKLYIAKIDYLPNGDGIFYHNGKPIHITKQQNKSLVYIGTLLATINKEYENDNFFLICIPLAVYKQSFI